MLKGIVVDDSSFYRKVLKDVLSSIPDVEISDVASNGKEALELVKKHQPDFITLDVEMPLLNGLETLKELKKTGKKVKTIMISSHTREGAQITCEALELGAFDFITKPQQGDPSLSGNKLKELLSKLLIPEKKEASKPIPAQRNVRGGIALNHIEIIGVGISTGGPQALRTLITKISPRLRVPIMIVQHMPPIFTAELAKSLSRQSSLKIVEAEDKMEINAKHIYIAPGGRQMKVTSDEEGKINIIRITKDPPEEYCQPSVNYTFRYLAQVYGKNTLGMILTGMGEDGVKGCLDLKRTGAPIITQSEETCTVYGMPRAVAEAGLADRVLGLDEICGLMNSPDLLER